MANTLSAPTLSKGARSAWVSVLQQMLVNIGIPLPKYGVDGDFGDETRNAVIQFQDIIGLASDGVVGDLTWSYLYQVQSGDAKTVIQAKANNVKSTTPTLPAPGTVEGKVPPSPQLGGVLEKVDWKTVAVVGGATLLVLTLLFPQKKSRRKK